MRRSEIFDSFVKIAQEQGLLSEAEHAEHTEKDFSETNPRHDSLTIEQIGKLYGTKPALPPDMEYKRNIIEDAHPEPVVLSPSHDKLNGLVENINERQNILLHIVQKEPDGHLTQRKYAEKNFVLSLVRVANELDNRGSDELRKLADACLVQATSKKKLTKVGWVAIAAGAIAAAVAILWLQQHKDFHSDGFPLDYQKTISEIDDLLKSQVTWYGTGITYTPQFIQTINKLKEDLGKLNESASKVIPLLQEVDKPRTRSELMEELAKIGKDPKTQEADAAITEFKNAVDEYGPEIYTVIADFSRQDYKDESTAEKGTMTKIVDWTEVTRGGKGLVSDDFDDVARALRTLWKDILGMYKGLQAAKNIKQMLEARLSQSKAEIDQGTKAPATPTAPGTPGAPGSKPAGPIARMEEAAEGLLRPGQ